MAYGESNSHVTVDVTRPPQGLVVTPKGLEPNISKTPGDAI